MGCLEEEPKTGKRMTWEKQAQEKRGMRGQKQLVACKQFIAC